MNESDNDIDHRSKSEALANSLFAVTSDCSKAMSRFTGVDPFELVHLPKAELFGLPFKMLLKTSHTSKNQFQLRSGYKIEAIYDRTFSLFLSSSQAWLSSDFFSSTIFSMDRKTAVP